MANYRSFTEVRMPFGKHKGKKLSEVPASYLWWLAEEEDIRYRDERLYGALLTELKDRLLQACPSFAPGFEDPTPPLVTAWYRGLALRHHPDRGGKDCCMKAINEAKDRLLEMLKKPTTN